MRLRDVCLDCRVLSGSCANHQPPLLVIPLQMAFLDSFLKRLERDSRVKFQRLAAYNEAILGLEDRGYKDARERAVELVNALLYTKVCASADAECSPRPLLLFLFAPQCSRLPSSFDFSVRGFGFSVQALLCMGDSVMSLPSRSSLLCCEFAQVCTTALALG